MYHRMHVFPVSGQFTKNEVEIKGTCSIEILFSASNIDCK